MHFAIYIFKKDFLCSQRMRGDTCIKVHPIGVCSASKNPRKRKDGQRHASKSVFFIYFLIFFQCLNSTNSHSKMLRCLVGCTEQRPPNIQARNSCLYAPNRLGSYTSTKTVTKQKHPLLPRPVQSIQNLSVTYYLTNKTSYCEK